MSDRNRRPAKLAAREADPLLQILGQALGECETALTMGTDHARGALQALGEHRHTLAEAGLPVLGDLLARAAGGRIGDLLLARTALIAAGLRLWPLGAARTDPPDDLPGPSAFRGKPVVPVGEDVWLVAGVRGGALVRGLPGTVTPLQLCDFELGPRLETRWVAGLALGVHALRGLSPVEERGRKLDWGRVLAQVEGGGGSVDLGCGLSLRADWPGRTFDEYRAIPEDALTRPAGAGPVAIVVWTPASRCDVVVARATAVGPAALG